jgi:hypothetical protein
MEKSIPILLSFVLTAVIGNWLVHKWQERNWLNQQRFLGKEKEYAALKDLSEEIGRLLGSRIYHMQRLAFALRASTPEALSVRLAEYDEVVKQWNERLASFYVRLPTMVDGTFGNELEQNFQRHFVELTSEIERLRKQKLTGSVKATDLKHLSDALNRLQGRSINFNKKLIHVVNRRRNETYIGTRLSFNSSTLHGFSNWELIKALFISDVESHSILRPPFDA